MTRKFQGAAYAPGTIRGYTADWAAFERWCQQQELTPLPAEPRTVANYLALAAELVDSTGKHMYAPGYLARWVASINKAHHLAGFAKPGAQAEVQTTMAGIRRLRASPPRRVAPLVLDRLRAALGEIDMRSWPGGLIGTRDYAILLIGFAGAFRRSELVALHVDDVVIHPEDGLHITARTSKTDQEGDGALKGVPFGVNPRTCAPCAYIRWLHVLETADSPRPERMKVLLSTNTTQHICRSRTPTLPAGSPLFRPILHSVIYDRHPTGEVVNALVKRRVAAAGFDPAVYGGHSLRTGFITEAFRAGRTHHEVMRQSHHKSVAMLEVYSRENDPLRHNAVTELGL